LIYQLLNSETPKLLNPEPCKLKQKPCTEAEPTPDEGRAGEEGEDGDFCYFKGGFFSAFPEIRSHPNCTEAEPLPDEGRAGEEGENDEGGEEGLKNAEP